MKSKYLDKVYDGMRKVIKAEYRSTHEYYTLENIYNHNKIEITDGTLKKLDDGKTTVGYIIRYQIMSKTKGQGTENTLIHKKNEKTGINI